VRRKFRVVTVIKWLKSVHIYRSYRQNKPGGPFFGTPSMKTSVTTRGMHKRVSVHNEHQSEPVGLIYWLIGLLS